MSIKLTVGDTVKVLALPSDIDDQPTIDYFAPAIDKVGLVVLNETRPDGKDFIIIDMGGRKGSVGSIVYEEEDYDKLEKVVSDVSLASIGMTIGDAAKIVSINERAMEDTHGMAELFRGATVAITRAGVPDYDYVVALPMGLGQLGMMAENLEYVGRLSKQVDPETGETGYSLSDQEQMQ